MGDGRPGQRRRQVACAAFPGPCSRLSCCQQRSIWCALDSASSASAAASASVPTCTSSARSSRSRAPRPGCTSGGSVGARGDGTARTGHTHSTKGVALLQPSGHWPPCETGSAQRTHMQKGCRIARILYDDRCGSKLLAFPYPSRMRYEPQVPLTCVRTPVAKKQAQGSQHR